MTERETPQALDRSVRQVFDDLVRVETLLWNRLDATVRNHVGIGLGSVEVLELIAETPNCRVQDIARRLAITVGGTSQAVDRLEAKALCQRRPNAADRRSSVLELTDAGAELLSAVTGLMADHLRTSLRDPLSDAAYRHLADAVRTLRHAAERPPAAAPAPAPQ